MVTIDAAPNYLLSIYLVLKEKLLCTVRHLLLARHSCGPAYLRLPLQSQPRRHLPPHSCRSTATLSVTTSTVATELHATPGTFSMEVAAPSIATALDLAPQQATPAFAPSSTAPRALTALPVAAPKTHSTSPSGSGAAPPPPIKTPSIPAMRPPIQHPTAAFI